MKLSELEGADYLVTKEYLDLRLQALEHRLLDQFHKDMIKLIMWFVSIQVTIAFGTVGAVYFMLAHWKP